MMFGAPSGAVGRGGQAGFDVEKMRPTWPSNPAYGAVESESPGVVDTSGFEERWAGRFAGYLRQWRGDFSNRRAVFSSERRKRL